jgi:hypothetical protein
VSEKAPERPRVPVPEGHLLTGGVAVVETVDPSGERHMRIHGIGECPGWLRIGLLAAALDRERDHLREGWS